MAAHLCASPLYSVVGHKRVSVATFAADFGLEDVKDSSGRVVQDAPLELWANLKQPFMI
jgi:hypothetical protein